MAGGVEWFIVLVAGYLLGSIPFGLILTRAFGAGDLRQIGSGNIGATNVLRTGRKGLAAATLLLDAAKGATAVCVARWWFGLPELTALAGLAALVGHCFPVWLGFRGGKGVATMLGVSFALDWRIGLASALVWLAMARLTKISSLGGMSSAVAAPVAALLLSRLGHPDYLAYAAALAPMAGIVLWRHSENIARLRAGTEPRVGSGRKP